MQRLGHKTEGLQVLHVPDNKDFEGMYKVDVEKRALVKVSGTQNYTKI
jgi:hypothetical protein